MYYKLEYYIKEFKVSGTAYSAYGGNLSLLTSTVS